MTFIGFERTNLEIPLLLVLSSDSHFHFVALSGSGSGSGSASLMQTCDALWEVEKTPRAQYRHTTVCREERARAPLRWRYSCFLKVVRELGVQARSAQIYLLVRPLASVAIS
jgi:hypothetical protein